MVYREKIHSEVVFFEEKWSFFLQDPIFLVFFGFSNACLSYICFYD